MTNQPSLARVHSRSQPSVQSAASVFSRLTPGQSESARQHRNYLVLSIAWLAKTTATRFHRNGSQNTALVSDWFQPLPGQNRGVANVVDGDNAMKPTLEQWYCLTATSDPYFWSYFCTGSTHRAVSKYIDICRSSETQLIVWESLYFRFWRNLRRGLAVPCGSGAGGYYTSISAHQEPSGGSIGQSTVVTDSHGRPRPQVHLGPAQQGGADARVDPGAQNPGGGDQRLRCC